MTNKLATFPEQTKGPCTVVTIEIGNITSAIAEQLRRDGRTEFRNEYKNVLTRLRLELKQARPHVVLNTPGFKKPAIDLSSDDDDESAIATPVPTPTKSRKGNNGRPIASPVGNAETPRTHRTPRAPQVKAEEGASLHTRESEIHAGPNQREVR